MSPHYDKFMKKTVVIFIILEMFFYGFFGYSSAVLGEKLGENKEALKMYQQGRFKEVIELFKKRMDTIGSQDLKLMSYSYQKLDEKENQFRILQQIISVNAEDDEGHVLMGDFLMTKKNYKGAANSYRTAVGIKKDYRRAYDGMIEAYQKADNRYELKIVYQDLIKIFGEKGEFINPLCRLFAIDGFFQQAIEYCNQGIALNPKIADNHVYLGIVLNKQSEKIQAQKILKGAAEKFINSEFAQRTYADLLKEQKNLIAAEKYYSAAVKADRKSLISQMALAKVAFELKDFEMSLEAYKSACLINTNESIKELRRSIAVLRLASNVDWLKKFSTAEAECGQSEPTKE
jgi:tetratricopeptide (TPR) repeat protein